MAQVVPVPLQTNGRRTKRGNRYEHQVRAACMRQGQGHATRGDGKWGSWEEGAVGQVQPQNRKSKGLGDSVGPNTGQGAGLLALGS